MESFGETWTDGDACGSVNGRWRKKIKNQVRCDSTILATWQQHDGDLLIYFISF